MPDRLAPVRGRKNFDHRSDDAERESGEDEAEGDHSTPMIFAVNFQANSAAIR